jgi:putative Holliday junction resolvase
LQNNIFNTLKQKYFSTEKRFLGIDYGDVNIGVAVSDVGRQIASPYAMLKNKSYKDLFPEIKKIVDEMDVAVIVLGLPLQMNGAEGETAGKVRNFAEKLSEFIPDVEIVFADERMTSAMSEKMLIREFDLSRKKRKAILDKVAAAEILQRVLDAF